MCKVGMRTVMTGASRVGIFGFTLNKNIPSEDY